MILQPWDAPAVRTVGRCPAKRCGLTTHASSRRSSTSAVNTSHRVAATQPPRCSPGAPGRVPRWLPAGLGVPHRGARTIPRVGTEVAEAAPSLVPLGLDFLTFLAATVLVLPIFRSAKISPVLGFLFTGLVLGQLGCVGLCTCVCIDCSICLMSFTQYGGHPLDNLQAVSQLGGNRKAVRAGRPLFAL